MKFTTIDPVCQRKKPWLLPIPVQPYPISYHRCGPLGLSTSLLLSLPLSLSRSSLPVPSLRSLRKLLPHSSPNAILSTTAARGLFLKFKTISAFLWINTQISVIFHYLWGKSPNSSMWPTKFFVTWTLPTFTALLPHMFLHFYSFVMSSIVFYMSSIAWPCHTVFIHLPIFATVTKATLNTHLHTSDTHAQEFL